MNHLRLLGTAAAMAGVLAVAACDGANLFTITEPVPGGQGPGLDDSQPPSVEILRPGGDSVSAKPLGDSVLVQASVSDDVGVAQVRFFGVALRGDPELGTQVVVQRFEEKVVTFDPPVRDTTPLSRYLIAVPDTVEETAIIVVEATDTVGNVSADTVQLILGGPDVELLDVEDGQIVQAGLNLNTRIRATDPIGIIQVRLEVSGAFQRTIARDFSPPVDSVLLDTLVQIPEGIEGEVQLLAVARNNLEVAGQAGPVTLQVVAGGLLDTIPPEIRQVETAPDRLELQDSVIIAINSADDTEGTGIERIGFTALTVSEDGDTLLRSDERTFDPPRTGNVTTQFAFQPFNVDSLGLPDTLTFEVTTYAYDAAGNCGAAVGLDTLQSLPCDTLPGGEIVAQNRTGERIIRTVVAGTTVILPAGGKIMDAVVDTTRRVLFLSNIEENQVEVFELDSQTFGDPIGVGSAPWGLTLNSCAPLSPSANCQDTLIVGNSGGTNLSNVTLGDGGVRGQFVEDDTRRLLTPDVVLFDIELLEDDAGGISYDVTHHPEPDKLGFSDRPQFVARDSTGRVLYSTRVVESLDQVGTIRKAENRPGYVRPEVKMFIEHAELDKNENFFAVGHVDQVLEGGAVTIVDHIPGTTTEISATGDPLGAAADITGDGSDIYIVAGATWNVANVGFQDTTFVSAAGDGGYVVFGEGGAEPVGRVIMYEAAADVISGWVEVTDLMTNAGESVRGIGLNYDGTLGVVRGLNQVGFFTTDLRLQGSPSLDIGGGAGAVMHPLHADAQSLENATGEYRPDTHLAFIGTSAGTIDIYDTFRFRRTGRLFIRDQITGPLRAALPLAADNLDQAGNPLQCRLQDVTDQTDRFIGQAVEIFQGGDFLTPWPEDGGTGGSEDRCIVLKLYGTTSAGGVVVIDVRKADVLRNHPAR